MYRIVSGAARYVVEDVFRVSPENISRIIHEVNTYIYTNLRPSFIQLPNDQEMEDSARLFYGHRRIINVIGAVDGTHIPILSNDICDINRKGQKSINCQAFVDAHMIVRHTTSGAK